MYTPINQYIERLENISFDVDELNKAVSELVKIRPFENENIKPGMLKSNGLGAISEANIGQSLTLSFEEMEREPYIDETRYTLFNPKLNNTYFKYVYDKINEFFEVGRCRVIKMPPRTTLSWHRDPEKRIHVAIKTNYGARMFIEHTGHHIPADGNIYLTDNTKYHTAINGGEEDRIHLVATVLGTK